MLERLKEAVLWVGVYLIRWTLMALSKLPIWG